MELVAKFEAGVVDTVANLLPVTLILAAILPPVANLTPVVHLALQIFEQIHNDPNVIFRGSGEGDS